MTKQELTWEKAEDLLKNNVELAKALNAAKTEEEANTVLKANGYEFTVEDLKDVLSERPLTDEEMEKVAGGSCFIIGDKGCSPLTFGFVE